MILILLITFYQRFLLFADYAMLVGLKFGDQVFDNLIVDPVVGLGKPYGQSVLDDIHESIIERRRIHDDKVYG